VSPTPRSPTPSGALQLLRLPVDAVPTASHPLPIFGTNRPPSVPTVDVPPDPRRSPHVAAVQVYGSDVPESALEMMSIQVELLLEELDRALAGSGSARYNWETVDPTFAGDRVLVAPTPLPEHETRPVEAILERARRGISMITLHPRRPPGFTRLALQHLEWIARTIELPGVTRLGFFAAGESAIISRSTLENLRILVDAAGDSREGEAAGR